MADTTVTFSYNENDAAKHEKEREVAPIAAIFEPNNSYADMEAFKGTTYANCDADDRDFMESMEAYLAKINAHGGIVAYCREAVRSATEDTDGTLKGEFKFVCNDAKDLSYFSELAATQPFKAVGITVTVA